MELTAKHFDELTTTELYEILRARFEFLMMEVMQCGLNWDLMIKMTHPDCGLKTMLF